MRDPEVQTSAQTCCLCGDPYAGHGNNPEPLSEAGRCCDDCNSLRVVPARMNIIYKRIDDLVEEYGPPSEEDFFTRLQEEKQSDKQVKYV